MTLTKAAAALRAGHARSIDLTESSLAAIAREQPRTNAFIAVDDSGARRSAAALDAELAAGRDRGPLHGLPISLKDLIDVDGTVTSAASRVLADRIATADADVVPRLRQAGVVFLGKTNLHEFALGTTSEDSAFGPVRNPADPSRSAGGSSGGSAAAVATGMGLASIGSDTGGSIRIPAACCGIVGLKPGFGEISTAGVIPLSVSLDHLGPLTRTVEDAAMIWAVLTGRTPTPVAAAPVRGMKLIRLTGALDAPIAPDVRAPFERALERLKDAGAAIGRAELPDARRIPEIYVAIVLAEAAQWHARYLDTRGDLYSPIVRSRLLSGRDISAVGYLDARESAAALRRAVDALLDECDALVLPTLPIVAPPLGAGDIVIDPTIPGTTPVRSAMLRQTQPFNLSGHPAISVPVPSPGLPVGLQLVGRHGETARLLEVAAGCEKIF
jgi:Asp-tRNA(Asn)/Glu-tRNA(Gln) amidotransferase A subunit family amidase